MFHSCCSCASSCRAFTFSGLFVQDAWKKTTQGGGFSGHTEAEMGAGTEEFGGGAKAKMGFSLGAGGRAGTDH